jgi:hypothetical protein
MGHHLRPYSVFGSSGRTPLLCVSAATTFDLFESFAKLPTHGTNRPELLPATAALGRVVVLHPVFSVRVSFYRSQKRSVRFFSGYYGGAFSSTSGPEILKYNYQLG